MDVVQELAMKLGIWQRHFHRSTPWKRDADWIVIDLIDPGLLFYIPLECLSAFLKSTLRLNGHDVMLIVVSVAVGYC